MQDDGIDSRACNAMPINIGSQCVTSPWSVRFQNRNHVSGVNEWRFQLPGPLATARENQSPRTGDQDWSHQEHRQPRAKHRSRKGQEMVKAIMHPYLELSPGLERSRHYLDKPSMATSAMKSNQRSSAARRHQDGKRKFYPGERLAVTFEEIDKGRGRRTQDSSTVPALDRPIWEAVQNFQYHRSCLIPFTT